MRNSIVLVVLLCSVTEAGILDFESSPLSPSSSLNGSWQSLAAAEQADAQKVIQEFGSAKINAMLKFLESPPLSSTHIIGAYSERLGYWPEYDSNVPLTSTQFSELENGIYDPHIHVLPSSFYSYSLPALPPGDVDGNVQLISSSYHVSSASYDFSLPSLLPSGVYGNPQLISSSYYVSSSNYGYSLTPLPPGDVYVQIRQSTLVPEPSAIALGIAGISTLCFLRWSKVR